MVSHWFFRGYHYGRVALVGDSSGRRRYFAFRSRSPCKDSSGRVLLIVWAVDHGWRFPSSKCASVRPKHAIVTVTRRRVLALTGTAFAGAVVRTSLGETNDMYGLIGKIRAAVGQRDALIAILIDGTSAMPGCLSYIVAKDAAEAEAIWVTEVWESRESWQASLSLPSVQQAIAKGRPLIAGFGERFETQPVGGQGLTSARG